MRVHVARQHGNRSENAPRTHADTGFQAHTIAEPDMRFEDHRLRLIDRLMCSPIEDAVPQVGSNGDGVRKHAIVADDHMRVGARAQDLARFPACSRADDRRAGLACDCDGSVLDAHILADIDS